MDIVGAVKEMSYFDLMLMFLFGYLLWKWVIRPRFFKRHEGDLPKPPPQLEPLPKQDFTVEQLRAYDGKGEDGRILLACDGKVFDVTRGSRFYGPDGPYGMFAGRDASRGMATFDLSDKCLTEQWDDLSDLGAADRDQLREWTESFEERYDVVGKLLKPGDEPTDYNSKAAEKEATSDDADKKDD